MNRRSCLGALAAYHHHIILIPRQINATSATIGHSTSPCNSQPASQMAYMQNAFRSSDTLWWPMAKGAGPAPQIDGNGDSNGDK